MTTKIHYRKLSIWIIENRIIEILSKESTPEELRRSMKIFYFLTKYEKLDSSILDTIWQSCIVSFFLNKSFFGNFINYQTLNR